MFILKQEKLFKIYVKIALRQCKEQNAVNIYRNFVVRLIKWDRVFGALYGLLLTRLK